MLDIVAAGVPFLVKILMECIAVVKEAMVEAPMMAVVSVECIHLAMVAITCLVAMMLLVALIHQPIPAVAWVVVVIWAVVILDLITKI